MTEPTPTVAELQDELRERELPVSGTKPELIERLAEADAAAPEAEAEAAEAEAEAEAEEPSEEEAAEAEVIAEAALVDDDGKVDTDQTVAYADDIRGSIAEMVDTLAALATVLTDLESRNVDPAGAAMMAASAKVRAHLDDVQRNLAPLSGAVQALANEAAAKPAAEV
jgi:paraquat-inducible protein B